MGNFRFSRRSKRNRIGVKQALVEISEVAIKLTVIDFGIPSDGGMRTSGRQNELFVEGKSKCDGYDKLSYHQSGKALDFYAYVDGKASWEPEHLAMVATAFLQSASMLGYKLKWGGLWESFKDMPHVQLG